jgi:hypothetical protein
VWSSLQSQASFGLPDAAIALLFFIVEKSWYWSTSIWLIEEGIGMGQSAVSRHENGSCDLGQRKSIPSPWHIHNKL